MANMRIVRADGSIIRNATEPEIAHAYRDNRELIWVDFDRLPTAGDLEFLRDLLGLGDHAIEHLSRTHHGTRVARFRAYMLAVIYDVALLPDTADIEQWEIVLLFAERFFISVHEGTSPRVAHVAEQLERSLRHYGVESGAIMLAVLETTANHYLKVIEDVRQRVDILEDRVLQKEQQEAINDLYQLRRQLIALRRIIAPEATLIGLRETPNPFIANPDIADGLLDIKHKLQRAVDEIDQDLSLLPDILTTFESLKSDNLNRILKLLTVWSIILTAVTLLPTVMGISLQRQPNVSPVVGYAISVGLMVLLGSLIWYVFKRYGWTE